MAYLPFYCPTAPRLSFVRSDKSRNNSGKITTNAIFIAIGLFLTVFGSIIAAQEKTTRLPPEKAKNLTSSADDSADMASVEATKKDLAEQKYRLLQSNGLLVETAYHQEEGELQHSFSFARSNRNNWAFNFTEEIPLGSERHQLSFSLPAQMLKNAPDGNHGFGDAKIEYSYFLYGGNSSRVTIAPGFGVTIPTGNSRKELGAGAPGISFKVPVSVMLTNRVASNSTFETTFTKSAKNAEGERAALTDFEIGQSLVWFARPKLNFLIEAVWERRQEVIGDGLRKSEQEFFVSPGVRWAHTFKNGLTMIPGVGIPIGIGPSSGERGIFFSLAFEHSFTKERE